MTITLSKLKRLFNRVASLEAASSPTTSKVWMGLLSQTGTSAPTAIVLRNDFDEEFVWQRDELGAYYVNIAGLFPIEKTFTQIYSVQGNVNATLYNDFGPPDYLGIRTSRFTGATFADEDNLLYYTPVRIEVFS